MRFEEPRGATSNSCLRLGYSAGGSWCCAPWAVSRNLGGSHWSCTPCLKGCSKQPQGFGCQLPLNHVPKCHIYRLCKNLQGWCQDDAQVLRGELWDLSRKSRRSVPGEWHVLFSPSPILTPCLLFLLLDGRPSRPLL